MLYFLGSKHCFRIIGIEMSLKDTCSGRVFDIIVHSSMTLLLQICAMARLIDTTLVIPEST